MPHKHKRRGDDESNYNLPPTVRARALPVGKQAQTVFTFDDQSSTSKKRKRSTKNTDDDTPRAFARAMRWTSTGLVPNGLDDGSARRTAKKPKKTSSASTPSVSSTTTLPRPDVTKTNASQLTNHVSETTPKILPGESLSDFGARVNHSLPIAGLARKTRSNEAGGNGHHQTRMEKKLQRGYAAWRAEEARLREKEEEARELAEEAEEEREAMYGHGYGGSDDKERSYYAHDEDEQGSGTAQTVQGGNGNAKVKLSKRKRRMIGEVPESKGEDPWAQLKEKRARPAGLHDVPLAPPTFTKLPQEKFKTVGASGRRSRGEEISSASSSSLAPAAALARVHNVPGAGKSLKQREELGETRKEIIERYRELMKRNRS